MACWALVSRGMLSIHHQLLSSLGGGGIFTTRRRFKCSLRASPRPRLHLLTSLLPFTPQLIDPSSCDRPLHNIRSCSSRICRVWGAFSGGFGRDGLDRHPPNPPSPLPPPRSHAHLRLASLSPHPHTSMQPAPLEPTRCSLSKPLPFARRLWAIAWEG